MNYKCIHAFSIIIIGLFLPSCKEALDIADSLAYDSCITSNLGNDTCREFSMGFSDSDVDAACTSGTVYKKTNCPSTMAGLSSWGTCSYTTFSTTSKYRFYRNSSAQAQSDCNSLPLLDIGANVTWQPE